MFSSAERSYQTQFSCDFISPDSCFFLIEHSAFLLFRSFTLLINQTLNDSKSLVTGRQRVKLFEECVDVTLWSFRRLFVAVLISNLPKAAALNQHVSKTTKTEHYSLHEGWIYCRTVVLECITFELCAPNKLAYNEAD